MGSYSVMNAIDTERDHYECKHCSVILPATNCHLMVHECFFDLDMVSETIFLDRSCELFRGPRTIVSGVVDFVQVLGDREEERSDLIDEFTIKLREMLMKLPDRKRKHVQRKILEIVFQPDELPELYNAFHLNDLD